jgi:hypothetical protein
VNKLYISQNDRLWNGGGASRTDGPVERGHLGNRSSGYYEEAFVFSALLAGICLPTTFLRAS